ncbi:hypothetical protein PCANC_22938 [Puccinia coronata f. sp. avenae]|jgi:hypothetical protein|uniref:Uncharacterized protein n=1 Tax=Puccinia coronata f. sp. avenae TaxID=200324 RepID=A0A2N5TLW8_9BASI|nr:hypothetical protein PCANC_22938 [Puccinia coronata f. sp. avenae]PLW31057.1 hypothetical protein PCASD_16054 [Puccinia coronata f. sp. avenae]
MAALTAIVNPMAALMTIVNPMAALTAIINPMAPLMAIVTTQWPSELMVALSSHWVVPLPNVHLLNGRSERPLGGTTQWLPQRQLSHLMAALSGLWWIRGMDLSNQYSTSVLNTGWSFVPPILDY